MYNITNEFTILLLWKVAESGDVVLPTPLYYAEKVVLHQPMKLDTKELS
jgi:hypothetical protein